VNPGSRQHESMIPKGRPVGPSGKEEQGGSGDNRNNKTGEEEKGRGKATLVMSPDGKKKTNFFRDENRQKKRTPGGNFPEYRKREREERVPVAEKIRSRPPKESEKNQTQRDLRQAIAGRSIAGAVSSKRKMQLLGDLGGKRSSRKTKTVKK